MMVCHCTMAGTESCKNCPRYIEYFGKKPVQITYSHELPTEGDELKELVKQAIKEAVKEVMRSEE